MTLDLTGERDLAIAEAILARAAARSGPALDFDVRAGVLTVKLGRKRWQGSPAEWARLLTHSDALRAAVAHVVASLDVVCAVCGEESGARGSSLYGSVHKWGPTRHRFKPRVKTA